MPGWHRQPARRRKGQTEKARASSDVPLQRVVMFNSGVGFFDRQGSVKGDAQIELKFNVDDINDLLKSMVAARPGGRPHLDRHLRLERSDHQDAQDLRHRPDQQSHAGPDPQPGPRRAGRDRRRQPDHRHDPGRRDQARSEIGKDHETIDVDMLNLLTDAGLRSVPLDSVGTISLLNEKLDDELRQALKVLALGHDTDKKTVTLNFLGDGKRQVRVGYIQETPIWKTSYRLVLKDDEAPFLQGWAIVENTTEEDWNKVDLTLVSGRPISFIMDLYEPLYVQRPVVEPELFASLRPQTYGQDLAGREREFA